MDDVGLQILTKKHGQNMFTMDGAFVFRQLLKDHAYYGYLDDSWYGNDKLCVHYMPSVNFITSDMADKNVAVGFTKAPPECPPIFNRGMNGGLVFLSDCAII